MYLKIFQLQIMVVIQLKERTGITMITMVMRFKQLYVNGRCNKRRFNLYLWEW